MLPYVKSGLLAVPLALLSSTALAASDSDIAALKQEIQNMKSTYEVRINSLEKKLEALQSAQQEQQLQTASEPAPTPEPMGSGAFDNRFNPAIGVIMNGTFANFSAASATLPGFAVGDEGGRLADGLSLGESELNFGANIDDKFSGSLTASIASDAGQDSIELEEAFIQTRGGVLPGGLNVKAGRMLPAVGYLNDHHTHTDDFADRPLPYRAYLNGSYKDDGAEVSWLLPTDIYLEVGGGAFRGEKFPFGTAGGNGIGAWSAFVRTGDDIGDNQNWRLGLSTLQGQTALRSGNDDNVKFAGNSDLYIGDLRYTWAPTGNPVEREVTLQGEYLYRQEKGTYKDVAASTGAVPYSGHDSGWYAQATYKFKPQWRVGARYAQLNAPSIPTALVGSELDAAGHTPKSSSVMVDWTNTEFSRLRLQYNREDLSASQTDDQLILQYTVSLGAHGAHSY